MAITVATAIAIGVGVKALSSLASYYQAEQARGRSDENLREVKKIFDAIKPPEYDLDITDPPELIAELPEPPTLDTRDISPEEIKQVAQYVPEFAEFVEYEQPELIADSEVGLDGLDAQMDVLRELSGIVETGEDPAFNAKVQLAAQRGQDEAQSRTQSILQDMARRGMLGSGIQASLQQQAASDTQARYADDMLMAAIAGRDNEMQAMRDLANLGGGIRNDELALSEANADIANRFNELGTERRQRYLENRAQTANQAQGYNIGEAQRIAESNIANDYAADVRNQEYGNQMATRQYGMDADRVKYQNSIEQQAFANKRANEDAIFQRQRQGYDDRMRNAAAQSGIYQQGTAQDMQNTRDRIQATQSLGDAAAQGAAAYTYFGGGGPQQVEGYTVGRGELPSSRQIGPQTPGPWAEPGPTVEDPSIYDDEFYKRDLYARR